MARKKITEINLERKHIGKKIKRNNKQTTKKFLNGDRNFLTANKTFPPLFSHIYIFSPIIFSLLIIEVILTLLSKTKEVIKQSRTLFSRNVLYTLIYGRLNGLTVITIYFQCFLPCLVKERKRKGKCNSVCGLGGFDNFLNQLFAKPFHVLVVFVLIPLIIVVSIGLVNIFFGYYHYSFFIITKFCYYWELIAIISIVIFLIMEGKKIIYGRIKT